MKPTIFRHSPLVPTTTNHTHTPGKQTSGMDAFDLEASTQSQAMRRANATRRVGHALVLAAGSVH